jgi:hypothetical protein
MVEGITFRPGDTGTGGSIIMAHGRNGVSYYKRPHHRAHLNYLTETRGEQFDPIERQTVNGSLPYVLERVEVN